MGGFECERVDMKWLALCTDGSTGCHQGRAVIATKQKESECTALGLFFLQASAISPAKDLLSVPPTAGTCVFSAAVVG